MSSSQHLSLPCRHSCYCRKPPSTGFTATSNRTRHEHKLQLHPFCSSTCSIHLFTKTPLLSFVSSSASSSSPSINPTDSPSPSSLADLAAAASSAAVSSTASDPNSSSPCTFTRVHLDHLDLLECRSDSLIPLPFVPSVEHALCDPSKHPLLHLQIHPSQKPNCMAMKHQPPRLHEVFEKSSEVYRMSLAEFAVNRIEADHYGEKLNFTSLYSPSAPPSMNETQFLDQLLNIEKALSVPYLKDMEEIDIWSSNRHQDESTLSSTSTHKKGRNRKRKQGESEHFLPHSQSYNRLVQEQPKHFLNTNLFTRHPLSLLSILPASVYWEGEWIHDLGFAGFSSASHYCKGPNSFFNMHVEQLFAPFYNYCFEGGTIWYAVVDADRQKLETYITNRAKQHFHLTRIHMNTELLLLALLYSKQLFLDPRQLIAAGIPVHRIEQQANQAVLGFGTVVHWGRCDERFGYSVNEAINFMPISWLQFGLPRLVEYLEFVQQYIQLSQSTSPQLLAAACGSETQRVMRNLVPRKWTRIFMHFLLAELKSGSSEVMKQVNAAVRQRSIEMSQRVIDLLNNKQISDWYNSIQSVTEWDIKSMYAEMSRGCDLNVTSDRFAVNVSGERRARDPSSRPISERDLYGLGVDLSYAECSPASVEKLLSALQCSMSREGSSSFVDLGCGYGKVVLHAAMQYSSSLRRCVGIEAHRGMKNTASQVLLKMLQDKPSFQSVLDRVEFITGDILDHMHLFFEHSHFFAFDPRWNKEHTIPIITHALSYLSRSSPFQVYVSFHELDKMNADLIPLPNTPPIPIVTREATQQFTGRVYVVNREKVDREHRVEIVQISKQRLGVKAIQSIREGEIVGEMDIRYITKEKWAKFTEFEKSSLRPHIAHFTSSSAAPLPYILNWPRYVCKSVVKGSNVEIVSNGGGLAVRAKRSIAVGEELVFPCR